LRWVRYFGVYGPRDFFRAVESAGGIVKIFARSHCPIGDRRMVGRNSDPYRDVPRKIHIFATPTGRTVPEILVARMTLLRQPGGRKSAGQKSHAEVPAFLSDPVELVGRTEISAGSLAGSVGGIGPPVSPRAGWRKRKFGARYPNAIRDFSSPLGSPAGSRKFRRARTVPARGRHWVAKRVTRIGTFRGKFTFRNAERAHCPQNFGRAYGPAPPARWPEIGRPKNSRASRFFRPTRSDFQVGPELWQEVPPTDLSRRTNPPLGPPTGWRKKISVHGVRTRSATFSRDWTRRPNREISAALALSPKFWSRG
jgi:hypothetical protein